MSERIVSHLLQPFRQPPNPVFHSVFAASARPDRLSSLPLGFETIGTYFAAEYRARGEGRLLRGFELGRNRRSHRWYRFYNEAPVLLLAAAVVLVVVKPF